jgi:tetratricopeptide (TPR) repeat protein
VLFLPLLVWTMVVCVDLHQREHGVLLRLTILATLLATLMLTRYSGVFLVSGVGLWWIWVRLSQRVPRRLLRELPILAAAWLPLAAWLFYTANATTQPVGRHFHESNDTFGDGLIGVAQQATQLLLPSLPTPDVMPENGFWLFSVETWSGTVLYILLPLLLLLLGYMFWRLYPGRQQLATAPRSPILICLAIYLGLYIFLQPFMAFWPMDQRDSTTMLALAMPWLFAATVPVFQRYAVPIVATFTAVNVALVLVPISLYAIPNVVTLVPPRVQSMAERHEEREVLLQRGVPSWLLTHIRRTRNIDQHHPDLQALIHEFEDVVVLSPLHPMFYRTTLPTTSPTHFMRTGGYGIWKGGETCTSQSVTMLVVLFEWDYLRPAYPRLSQELAAYCPHAPRTRLEHTLVYRLDQTIPEYPQGQQYLEQGRWDDAIAIFDAALAFNPDNVQAYADRGTASMELEAWDAALADFEQAIARLPGWSYPYQQRAAVYEALGEPRLAQADRAQATELELAYLGTTPTNRLTLLAEQEDWERLITEATVALAEDPTDIGVLYRRANTYRRLGEQDAALADYTRIIEIDPTYALAYHKRGLIYREQSDFARALADLNQAVTLEPDTVQFRQDRAVIFRSQHDIAAALADLEHAIAIEPFNPHLYYHRGLTHAAAESHTQAVADYERVLLFSSNSNLQQAATDRLLEHLQHAETTAPGQATALDLLDDQIALQPDNAALYARRAALYQQQGDRTAAITDYSHAIALAPAELDYYYQRGNLYLAVGNFAAAIADFDHVIAADPTHALAYHKRGLAYREQGNAAQALADYSRSIELRPDFAPAYYVRAQIYAERGDEEAAQADYERVTQVSDDPALRAQAQEALAAIQ